MRNALQSIQNPYKNLNAYSIFIKKDSKSKICKQRSNYSTFGKFFALLTTESRQEKMLTLLQAQKSNDKLAEFYLLHHEKYFV